MNEVTTINRAQRDYSAAVKKALERAPQLYINGEWVDSSGGATIDVEDPSSGKIISKFVEATDKEKAVGPLLTAGYVKLINDGVLSAHTAVLMESYHDREGWTGEYITGPAELAQQVLRAAGLETPSSRRPPAALEVPYSAPESWPQPTARGAPTLASPAPSGLPRRGLRSRLAGPVALAVGVVLVVAVASSLLRSNAASADQMLASLRSDDGSPAAGFGELLTDEDFRATAA